MAILFPSALLLILAIVQAGMAWHAHNVLAESAHAGVSAGRVLHASTADAHAAALGFVRRAGTNVVTAPTVRVERTGERVSVTVSGVAPRVLPLPGLTLRLSAGATAPVERWTTTSGGFSGGPP